MPSIANEFLSVEINPRGAETHAIRDALGRDWLWHGDAARWSGRAPILFPIVGAAKDGVIAYGERTCRIEKHGFARRSDFSATRQSATECCLTLVGDAATLAAFPFRFALSVTHRLEGPSLEVSARVENHDTVAMPFGFGFHPAFRWPLPGARGAHRIVLDNGAEPALARIGEDGLLRDERHPSPFEKVVLSLETSLFDDDALIFPEGAGDGLRFEADGASLRFTFENLPNLALWQKPGAPYLCIEPWHGMAARAGASPQMTERPGTLELAPGRSAEFSFTVTFPA